MSLRKERLKKENKYNRKNKYYIWQNQLQDL